MARIRCIKNIWLDVKQQDGSIVERPFRYGRYYWAKSVEEVDDEYVNILLESGGTIKDVSKQVFEYHPNLVSVSELKDSFEEDDEDGYVESASTGFPSVPLTEEADEDPMSFGYTYGVDESSEN